MHPILTAMSFLTSVAQTVNGVPLKEIDVGISRLSGFPMGFEVLLPPFFETYYFAFPRSPSLKIRILKEKKKHLGMESGN